MLRLVHSCEESFSLTPSRTSQQERRRPEAGRNLRTNYFSDIWHHDPLALTRFFTYSTYDNHIRLASQTVRMQEFLQENPESPRSYEGMDDSCLRPIRLYEQIEAVLDRYTEESGSNGLLVEVTPRGLASLLYEAHFIVADLVQLRRSALTTKDPIRLEFLNTVGVESLLKDAVQRMTVKTSRHH